MLGSDKQYCHRSIQLQYLRIVFVDKSQFKCSIDVTVDNLDGFDCFFFCFFLRLTICPVVNFVFLRRHKNLYLLFPPRFSLILFSL